MRGIQKRAELDIGENVMMWFLIPGQSSMLYRGWLQLKRLLVIIPHFKDTKLIFNRRTSNQVVNHIMHYALYHPLSLKWIENCQIPVSDYTEFPLRTSLKIHKKNWRTPTQCPGEFGNKRSCDELCSYLQGDKNGVANAARLTVTCACGEIACQEAKEISFPDIFWPAWAKPRMNDKWAVEAGVLCAIFTHIIAVSVVTGLL